MDALAAEDVSRRYGDTVALDGVSLRVPSGEIFALVGPNGAGKTTLVRALTGTTDAEGEVSVFGDSPEAVSRDRIGLLPQAFTPPERLTPRELLDYFGGLYDERRDTEAVLSDVGLKDAADTYYENLSGGQQRRTCVGATLVNEPDLLFLDEPTTGIDPAGRRALWDLLENLADSGTTIFLTTHDMAEAERLADRVGLLANGELVALDEPETLVRDFGGDQVLQVEGTFDGVPDLDYSAELSDGVLRVKNVPPTAIGEVVAELEAAGTSYESLTWTEPDLEDVYLALAGEDASGEPADAADSAATVATEGRS